MSVLKVGDQIPSFCLTSQDNTEVCVKPSDQQKRVIYFYPKNNTRKCTEQACAFRDWQDTFLENGYLVIGISSDSVKSHIKFTEKYHLNFTLLSDRNRKVRSIFGANSFFGLIPSRKTFLVNEAGNITFIHDALLEGEEHAQNVINQIK